MIKLMNNQASYTSPEFTHTATNGGTLYTFSHNFNSEPSLIIVQAFINGIWLGITDQYYVGIADVFGWQTDSSSTLNSAVLRIARPTYSNNGAFDAIPSPCTLRVVCFRLGTTQTISNITPAFQWSSQEQVYPFEKDDAGNTLYCKKIELGTLPNTGTKAVAFDAPAVDIAKVYKMWGSAYTVGDSLITLPRAHVADANCIDMYLNFNNYMIVGTGVDMTAKIGKAYIIYAK